MSETITYEQHREKYNLNATECNYWVWPFREFQQVTHITQLSAILAHSCIAAQRPTHTAVSEVQLDPHWRETVGRRADDVNCYRVRRHRPFCSTQCRTQIYVSKHNFYCHFFQWQQPWDDDQAFLQAVSWTYTLLYYVYSSAIFPLL